jgi:hypothetical protein
MHVLPAQAEQLAFAHAEGHGKDVESFERVAVCGFQETVNLCAGERLDVLGAAMWGIDCCKRVGDAVTTLGSTVERRLERHVDVMSGGPADPAGE